MHAFCTLIHAMLPSIVRRVLLPGVGGSRVLPYTHLTPLQPPRCSLQYNDLTAQAKQAVKDAAGSNVSVSF